ncbi:MAG TPA: hypothetical protein ENK57_25910 [Polyangiaceae bacterium]|nr:hypothetical protein [Polyangiaceae bacterium]
MVRARATVRNRHPWDDAVDTLTWGVAMAGGTRGRARRGSGAGRASGGGELVTGTYAGDMGRPLWTITTEDGSPLRYVDGDCRAFDAKTLLEESQ